MENDVTINKPALEAARAMLESEGAVHGQLVAAIIWHLSRSPLIPE